MTFGTMATDCEIRIDFDKLRRDRLSKANEQLKKDSLGALLCFDPDSIRYITSTRLNDWTNNKLVRSCLLAADQPPILFEVGSAIETKKKPLPLGAGTHLPLHWRNARDLSHRCLLRERPKVCRRRGESPAGYGRCR